MVGRRRLERVQVVYKKSAYELYVQKHRDPKIAALVESDDSSVQWMLQSHQENQSALAHVRDVLKARRIQVRWSYRAKKEAWQDADLVLAVGGDGTLLEAARMVRDATPVLGLHSTPTASVGYLCAAHVEQIEEVLDRFVAGALAIVEVPRMRVFCNGEPVGPPALNDVLFASPSPAATSRYHIVWREQEEMHRSSGVWIATGVGSTAAILSAGGTQQPPTSRSLQFAVRELYQPHTPMVPVLSCAGGLITADDPFAITSLLRRATLYFDGPWTKVPVDYNDTLTFGLADEPLLLGEQGG